MSDNYKFHNPGGIYFISFAVVDQMDMKLRINIGLIIFISMIFISCGSSIKKERIYYPNGVLNEIKCYDEESGVNIVDSFAMDGRLLERKELLNNERNGRQFLYNPESNVSKESFYVDGVKHGVYRVDIPDKKISFERLYLDGVKVRVKYLVRVTVNGEIGDSINFCYNDLEIGEGGKPDFKNPRGIIKINNGRYVGIFDLDSSAIDFHNSIYFFDDLKDTIVVDKRTNFEINLESFLGQDSGEKYLYSELLLGNLDHDLVLQDTLDVFRSKSNANKIECSIKLKGGAGYRLITGKLRRFFLDKSRNATFYAENIFYKQVFLLKD